MIVINRMIEKDKISIFKEIMGNYPTGVTIVTTMGNGETPIGLTVNSFASVSIDPLLVLWCVDKRFSSLEHFINGTHFAVHTLSSNQADTCWAFAGKENDRFAKVNWKVSQNGLPIIQDSLGILECKTVQVVDAGDHFILIGEVIDLSKTDKDPMLYYNRSVGKVPVDWPGN